MPTPTYIPLGTITLASTDSEIVFSSIPATYRDLIISISGISTASVAVVGLRFNGDTASNYSFVNMFGTGSTTGSNSDPSDPYIGLLDAFTSAGSMTIAQIMDYSATDKHKTALLRRSFPADSVAAAATRWASTDAINSITIYTVTESLAAGSTISIYGIA